MNELPILLYPHHVQKLLGIGPTKFYEIVKLSDFPKPRNLLGKRSVYLRNEIEEWANNLEKIEVKKGHGGRYVGSLSKTDTQSITKENS